MPTIIVEGQQTAVVGTIHSLFTDTTNKIYTLHVDLSPMQNGDVVELYLLTKLSSQSTQQFAYRNMYANIQSEPNKYSVPVPADVYIEGQMLQSSGTGRVFYWKLVAD